MNRHTFGNWSAIRDRGLQRAMIQADEVHTTCTICEVSAKRRGGHGAWLGQPAKKPGPIKYWVDGRWSSKSPPCQK